MLMRKVVHGAWCWLQVGMGLQTQCKRILSDLLPAAELLLRGVLSWRHARWHKAMFPITKQEMVMQARCWKLGLPD